MFDDHGEILEGTFNTEEIQKVIKQDDVYKIQNVLKKRRKGRRVQYLVKWPGFLQFDRQVVNADYDNGVQDEYLTQKYDLRSRYLFSKGDPRQCAVRVTR
jgi:hypothetical protein